MILLDTNVISEPLKAQPVEAVVRWLDAQSLATLYLSALTVAEIRYGIAVLPTGRRREGLAERFESEVLPAFGPRVLSFDEPAATAYANLRAAARAAGYGLGVIDAQIAAIASVAGFSVATRDTAPFEFCGVGVINPFE